MKHPIESCLSPQRSALPFPQRSVLPPTQVASWWIVELEGVHA